MKSFKQILFEDPDGIGTWDDAFIGFRHARYTWLLYNDSVDNAIHWIAYDYSNHKILSSSKSLHNELYVTKSHVNYRRVAAEIEEMIDFPAHTHLRGILNDLGRFRGNITLLDGRLYEDNGNWYFPFWQNDLFKYLNRYKSHIDNFLASINLSKTDVKFEDENDDAIFHTYEKVFGKSEVPIPTASDEQRRMKQMKLDLHINKGKLDKAIVQALQSRPKDVNTLYQRLEKQFGMPIAQIKHTFGVVPLDKLIAKKARELNESKILLEYPEQVRLPSGNNVSFWNAKHTLLIYEDMQSKKVEWAAYQYKPEKILASNKNFRESIERTYVEDVNKSAQDYKDAGFVNKSMFDLNDMPSHYNLRSVLKYFGHVPDPYPRSVLDGRIFEENGNWYISFWQSDSSVTLTKYKDVFDDFLKSINVPADRMFFEDESDSHIFNPYGEVFKNLSPSKSTEAQRNMKQLQWDLHAKKGQLDKAVLQALQTKPKDVNALYQRLEKEFGMPIVQIKHLYGAVPLDKLIARKAKELVNESMFPKDFDRHSLGSCMAAAAMATDYLLSKGRKDFKVVEGMVSLYPDQEYRDWSPHTWIQFNNGKIFDPTKKQWKHWGFNPEEVKFKKTKRVYTPEEYQSVCQRQPDDVSKFKKMAEATMMNDEIPEKLYHGTFRPLLDEILSEGIVPGGKDTQNFDWAGKFVYLAETPENAISFVEVSENDDIPEEWFGDIVVLEVDVSKLDLTKMMPDENWNPSTGEGEEGYRSFQYEGVVSPDAITVL